MKLLTKAIEKKLEKTSLYSTDAVPVEEKAVLVKFFNPYGSGTWFVFEAEKLEGGDYRFFGLAHIHEWELGYFLLSELMEGMENTYGLPLERDLHWHGKVTTEGKRAA